ncbi:inactive leucine-rich repeat receptor protein kinase IMK2 [Spatholobus suberectus]|nr:inactive leucine-rich repeat receptor protein kinase IMK2 [Spatholobus suberectus]
MLSNNHFHGSIPKFSNDTNLLMLLLNNNNLNCTLEEVLESVNGKELETLDISYNSISGEIPNSIVKLSSVRALLIAKNKLEGEIPFEFSNLASLYMLDLSQNRLSGSISHVNLSTLMFLNLKKNVFSGSIPITLSEGSNLVTLDLRDNNFSGNIPYWMDNLSNLRMLSLGENNFIGYIPIQLCRLQKIAIMDLSHNKIKGSIPSCFNSLPFGREEESEDPFQTSLLGEIWIEDGLPTYDFNEEVKDSVAFRWRTSNTCFGTVVSDVGRVCVDPAELQPASTAGRCGLVSLALPLDFLVLAEFMALRSQLRFRSDTSYCRKICSRSEGAILLDDQRRHTKVSTEQHTLNKKLAFLGWQACPIEAVKRATHTDMLEYGQSCQGKGGRTTHSKNEKEQSSWIVKQSAGKKACLVGQALLFLGKELLELGVNIGTSTVASGVVSLVLGYLNHLGNTREELPEFLLGTCHLNHLDASKSVCLRP